MATFSAVTRQHILQAIADWDDRGRDAFLGVYGFTAAPGTPLLHEDRAYDAQAILGVAHRYATGRVATAEEFRNSPVTVADLLRKRGFDVPGAAPVAPAPARRTAAKAATAPRTPRRTSTPRASEPEKPPAVCPTCFTVLPATGICDDCG
ncbi:hypothetical protein ACFWH7_19175 [Cellulosimicrobium cellulans]|uniref:ScoMcrA-like N-terminal head domain-containing protein n=1 Tax=Cellulosimicrobium cellulans TaxID=1710 RepID=A0A4Y4E203_CELCE|nr:hypothetical protein [Cellulosimicrobium cellulans]GED11013.1 hypothetical protein CCE02nite_30120 [Cellulosimicrobium cellulans]